MPRHCRRDGPDVGVAITPADVQDRDGFIPLLKEVRRVFVVLQRIFADGGYSGAKTAAEAKRAGKVEQSGRTGFLAS